MVNADNMQAYQMSRFGRPKRFRSSCIAVQISIDRGNPHGLSEKTCVWGVWAIESFETTSCWSPWLAAQEIGFFVGGELPPLGRLSVECRGGGWFGWLLVRTCWHWSCDWDLLTNLKLAEKTCQKNKDPSTREPTWQDQHIHSERCIRPSVRHEVSERPRRTTSYHQWSFWAHFWRLGWKGSCVLTVPVDISLFIKLKIQDHACQNHWSIMWSVQTFTAYLWFYVYFHYLPLVSFQVRTS